MSSKRSLVRVSSKGGIWVVGVGAKGEVTLVSTACAVGGRIDKHCSGRNS